jgi:hypothetical protein
MRNRIKKQKEGLVMIVTEKAKREIKAVRFFSRDGCLYLVYIDNHRSFEKKATELEAQLREQMNWRQINSAKTRMLLDFFQQETCYYEDIFKSPEYIVGNFKAFVNNKRVPNTQNGYINTQSAIS